MDNYISSKSPWWLNRRIKLVCVVVVTSLLMLTATLTVFGHNHQKSADSKQTIFVPPRSGRFVRQAADEEVCTTPGCVRTAEEILKNLDEKIDPCGNFYKFACGGWIGRHTIPDDKSQVSAFDDVRDELNIQLKALVEKESDESEPKTVQMIKDMYASCINLDNIEKAGSEPLQKVLKSLGGWPVVLGDNWDETSFDWMKTTFAFRKLGYNYNILFSMVVFKDLKNNKVNVITLDQASLGMPDRSYLLNGLNDSATQAYFNMMVKAAKKLGANEQTVEKELLQALKFETTLANYSLPNEERRNYDKMYNKMTISQLRELAPQIDWVKYFNGLLNDPITESETVVVFVPNFLKQFGELITKTDKRIVANYMMWRVVSGSLSLLSKEWKDLEQEYTLAITGQSVEKPRWDQCISMLKESLGIALGSYYIKHYFKEDSKQKATEMVGYIRKEFLKILEEIDWMDDITKREAKEKAEAIHPYIGYPQELSNDSLVVKIYENLTIRNDDYFENILHIVKWYFDDAFSKLRKPNVKGDWKDHANAAIVNAFYNPLENSIDFPAGILQNVFFRSDRPNYMNFGAIGFVIGHEITHGFDDMGKQFDKEGNSRNWWDETTDEHFKDKAKCIIYQYGNYTTEIGLQLNGINTQGENIADNGGLKQAYRAYHSWIKDHGSEGRLPGLKYTPSQLFWISAANVWCGKTRPEYLKLMILADPHSPLEFRVIGPMSNLKGFSEAFGCPLGSEMNPEKKCQVW